MTDTEYGFIRDSHYLVIKRDHANTKESKALEGVHTDKRNAVHAMEEYVYNFIVEKDGDAAAENSAMNPLSEVQITYACKYNFRHPIASKVRVSNTLGKVLVPEKTKTIYNRDTGKTWTGVTHPAIKIGTSRGCTPLNMPMEKTDVDSRWTTRSSIKFLPYGHYVTRNPNESLDRLTVWKKQAREVSGRLYGTITENEYTKIFSVEIIEVPNCTYNNILIDDEGAQAYTEYDYAEVDTEEEREARENWRLILVGGLSTTLTMINLEERFNNVKAVGKNDYDAKTGNVLESTQVLKTMEYPALDIKKIRQEFRSEFVRWNPIKKDWVPEKEMVLNKDNILEVPVENIPENGDE